MEIIKLPAGQEADDDTDCIKIEQTTDGRFSLMTSALVVDGDGEGSAEDSAAVIDSDGGYASYEEAEAAGVAWASDLGVQKLYVEIG